MLIFKPINILFYLLLLIPGLALANSDYSQIYIFGDSLSDTGNAASVVGDFPPPYYMNRASNGPVAVETFTAALGHTADASLHFFGSEAGGNYAVAGANAVGDNLEDLGTQIAYFHAIHNYAAPTDALYVIFIGGNDIRATYGVTDKDTAVAIINSAVVSVKNAMQSLTLAGAKHFLLINAPNVSLIPEAQIIATLANDPDLIKRIRKYSKLYSILLHDMVEQFETVFQLDIEEFNLFKFFTKLIKKGEDYGFTNTTDACFDTQLLSFHPDCHNGLNADQFIFFDEIHPTTRAHQFIGEAMFEALQKSASQ